MMLLAKHRTSYIETYSLLATSQGDIRGNPGKFSGLKSDLSFVSALLPKSICGMFTSYQAPLQVLYPILIAPPKPELIILFYT